MNNLSKENWISLAGMSSAVLAVLAGLSGLGSVYYGNSATRELIRSSNQWNHFQAKGIKANLRETKLELMAALKKEPLTEDHVKIKEYRQEQEMIAIQTKEKEQAILHFLEIAGLYSRSVTFFQIAIGVVAVALLTRKKYFWFFGMVLAFGGFCLSLQALVTA